MKLSLSNGIFSKLKIRENFALVKQLGFSEIEFNMKSIRKEHDTDVYREKKALAASGLNCLTIHSAVLHVKDPIEVHQAVYYGKISLECACALQTSLMTVHSNVSKKLPKQIREQCLRDVFGEITPFAEKKGIKLALENLSYTSTGFGRNPQELDEVLGIIDPKGKMGITIDLCHALETREVDNLLEAYGKRICNVHMANKAHRPFKEKTPELTSFLASLRGYGYSGPITLELDRKTSIDDIAKTKALFDELLKE
ncbi:MAG TPA: sugar phosphate isomerase/epimerase family protein [Candidatus Nanoarchaeia archaeon]|nr:sugar phosphate isomerase/epimerase family protein [Candidatus Nanoarchaeia archaeon]